MFYFRLNQVRVIDNKDGGGWFGSDGKPTIQFLSFVTSEKILGVNEIKDYNNENDPAKKREILKRMVDNVTATLVFTPINEVRDGTVLKFGEGLNLFETETIPRDFSWRFIGVKLKDKTREIGEEIGEISKDADFTKFADGFPALIGAAGSPIAAVGVSIGKFIFSAIGRNLRNKKDRIIGSLETSFIEKLHYPNGIREGKNITETNSSHPSFTLDYLIINISDAAVAVGGK